MDPKSTIIERSKELFERFGYHKTTLTDIAKSVGKVKTAIYYYFSGKEEIFAQLVRVEAEAFLKQLIREVNKEPDYAKKLEVYVETRIILMQKISVRYSFLKKEFFELMGIVDENRKVYDLQEKKFIEEIIEKGIELKQLHVAFPKFAATMLVNTLKGLEVQMYVTDQILIHKNNLTHFRNHILYGYVTKPEKS